jgi:1L-myo-inositol 1-phosphate cytidylyltransferase
MTVTRAVILMAGTGSRLRVNGETLAKPLMPVGGRPLVAYTLEALARAGIKNVCAVVGFESERVIEQVTQIAPPELNVRFVFNPDWKKQLGLSVLAARGEVNSPFLLTMSDHLYDDALLEILLRNATPDQINLAVDRKIKSIFDIEDATKVRTDGDRIVAIAKDLSNYNAIDTGLFICSLGIFDYLEKARENGDCSLSDGVRLAAAEGKARAIDIGEAWWQDVDTPEMLVQAERVLRARPARTEKIGKEG